MSDPTPPSETPPSRSPAPRAESGAAPPPETAYPYVPPEDEISLLQLLSVVLKRRYTVLGWTFGAAFLVVAYTLLTFQPTYTSEAWFIPQGAQQRSAGDLQALAGQFGVSVPSDGGSESPQFYADLLRSREILRHVLADTFTVNQVRWGDTIRKTGTILDLLEIDEDESEARRREAGIRWLKNAVSTNTTRETGVVQLSVQTPWPHVSRDIAQRLVDLANEFNLRTRQSQASAERAFIEERLEQARQELREAEEEFRRFLENNRQFQNSPELVFEHDRLQRQVAMRQQVFTSLSQSYEDARISEVRDTPVITVVEPPEEPVQRDPRRLALRGALGLMLGGMLGMFTAFGREMVDRSRREGDDDYQEFHEVWRDTVGDLRRLTGWLRRSSDAPPS